MLAMRLSLVALLLPAMVACGGGDGASRATSTAPESSSSPTPTPTPTPARWSKDEAGQRYLAMVEPTNRLIAAYNAAGDWREQTRICGRMLSVDDRFMRRLAAGKWPTNVQDEVEALVTELASLRGATTECSNAASVAELNAAWTSSPTPSGAGQRLRVALGLPGTPTS